jgi:alpha-ribazole phosphatase
MEIYLIRHTTPAIAKGICYGQSDLAINTNTFEEELQEIKRKLPNDIELMYSSPLQRCTDLAKRLSSNFQIDERVLELNFGNWEGQPWNTINTEELNPWMADFVHTRPPNGESYIELHKRTLDFIQSLLLLPQQKIAVVGHAGTIRSILCHVLGLSLENSFRIQLHYGAVVHVKIDKEEGMNMLLSMQ